ncbi:MAG: hypothetical protein K5669_01505 [Lachnospiraceae bacterium]|nr:hypothetical protein [Lachnospiraceae bacterium]
MIIKKIRIENFGKLSDFEMDFKSGVNTVLENNGWGKSTLASFVRVMFYGFDGDSKKKGVREKERSFFKPWNGGAYGGSIEFKAGDKDYVLLRTFGATVKSDSFDLRDAATALVSDDFTAENLGYSLFGLDSESYKKTSYIDHTGIKYEGVGSDVSSKAGNLPQGEDIAAYDGAAALINNYLNTHSPTRATGSLNRKKKEISEMTVFVSGGDKVDENITFQKTRLDELSEKELRLKSTRKELDDEVKAINKDRERAVNHRLYLDKVALKDSRKKDADELLFKLGGSIPDDELCTRAERKLSELDSLNAKAANLVDRSDDERFDRTCAECREKIERTYDLLDEKYAEKEEAISVFSKALSAAKRLTVISIVMMAVAAALFGTAYYFYKFKNLYYIGGAGVLFIIGLVLLIIGLSKKSRASLNLETAKNMDFSYMEKDIENAKDRIRKTEDEKLYLQKAYIEEKEALSEKGSFICDDINSLLEKIGKDKGPRVYYRESTAGARSFISDIKVDCATYRRMDKDYDAAKRSCDEFLSVHPGADEDPHFDENAAGERLSEIEKRGAQLLDEINETSAERTSCKAGLSDLYEKSEEINAAKETLLVAKEEYESGKEKYLVAEKTLDYLTEAKDRLIAGYMEPLRCSFERYYDILKGDDAPKEGDSFIIDANLNLQKKELGAYRSIESLSDGISDMTGLCMRAALLDVMYDVEKPVIIMDDPFSNLDEENVKWGYRFLESLAQEYQIIYLTCHPGRAVN